jgi:hypothetical protein
MATSEQRRDAEERMRHLLESADLPAPDHVEHGDDEIALFWHDHKVVVEIDLRDAPPAEPMGRGGFEPPSDGL